MLDAIKREPATDSTDDFLISATIGAATGSALVGGLLGGSLFGGLVGDALEGDDDSWF